MNQVRPAIKPPSTLNLLGELRALLELGSLLPSLPLLRQLPRGDGHPVLVYPCFLATNRATAPLRRYLRQQGYDAHGWRLGRNQGYSPALEALMRDRLWQHYRSSGRKLSLIGWSLGGIYAREMARAMPEAVRQVITLGSPFGNPQQASNLGWLYDLVSGERLEALDPHLVARLMEPPPVPSTAIFSRGDGIVAWQCAVERVRGPITDNVEVVGSHLGLGHNPLALYVIADRLAQPEAAWRPFDRSGARALFFPDPTRGTAVASPTWRQRLDALDQAIARLERVGSERA